METAEAAGALVEYLECVSEYYLKGGKHMANDKKWRQKKMAKHKHRKRLKKTRWKRRQKT